jgi:alkanesulfonate monooxygenase SsuD/methylene tetrahydromethanopterin reductase-like flavin-dependent oxidoreductase (luciferase family)
MAADLRERRADSRVILRINVFQVDEPQRGEDERGRHAIAGPPEWIAERLSEYVDAGCDGFVLNLDYESPDLEERVRRFADEVVRLLSTARELR